MSPVSLPGSLFDTYARYKLGTSAIIHWLSAHVEGTKVRTHVNSVGELRYLANVVIAKHIKVSADLLQDLKDTIHARMHVSNFFKSLAKPGDQEISSSHEHFTGTLVQILGDLRRLSKESSTTPTTSEKVTKESQTVAKASKNPTKAPSNVFEFLDCDECLCGEDDQFMANQDSIESSAAPEHSHSSASKGIERDGIGDFMALALYLSQLDNLMVTVKESWEKAASGLIPIVVAASTNNMAYRAAQKLEKDLEEYDIYNPVQFLTRYNECLKSLNLSDSSSIESSNGPGEQISFRQQKGPQRGWLALEKFKGFWQSETGKEKLKNMDNCDGCPANRPCSCPWDEPVKFQSKHPNRMDQEDEQSELDRMCLDLILKRMGQLLIVMDPSPLTCIAWRTPLLHELACFLQSDIDISCSGTLQTLSLSFGLEMLVQGMTSYFQDPGDGSKQQNIGPSEKGLSPPSRPGSCRLQSLKFAKDVLQSVDHLLANPNAPCGCLKIGSVKVAEFIIASRGLVGLFIQTKRFDLFFQSPWISGQHMVGNLVNASSFGAKAWHHAYYVGTALHIYNTLIQLGAISSTESPLVDRLCLIFEEAVFMGQRPSRNLLTSFQRWSGGCISFPKGRCRGMHSHSHVNDTGKKWSLKYVRDVSQGGNDPKRGFNPMKISIFSLLSSADFVLDDDVLAWAYCSKSWRKATAKDIQRARTKRDAESFIARSVEVVQDKIVDEFQGDFPIPLINYPAVYELCVEILKRINEAEHPTHDPNLICSCVPGRLMRAADDYLDDMHVVKVYQERELVVHCQKAFRDLLADKSFSDFLWKL